MRHIGWIILSALLVVGIILFAHGMTNIAKNITSSKGRIAMLEDQLRIANSQKAYWERAYKHPNRIHIETYLPDLTSMQINIDFPTDRTLTSFERILIRDEIMEIVYSESFKAGFEFQKELQIEDREKQVLNDEYLNKYSLAETDEEKMKIQHEALKKANMWEAEKRQRIVEFFKKIDSLPRYQSFEEYIEEIKENPVE